MKKIMIANWKMNPVTLKEAKKIFDESKKVAGKLKKITTVICPPSVFLSGLKDKSPSFLIGAQDGFYEEKGAFTGEVSLKMLKNVGAKYVIIGHSERRAMGETSATINQKIKTALSLGLKVIFCVGERERDPEGDYLFFVKNQILDGLAGIPKDSLKNLLLAYEPVWAISSNKGAKADSPDSSFQMSIFIRRMLLDIAGDKIARSIPVLYGGSVSPKNIEGFLKEGGVQGALVGSKSLSPKDFGEILRIAERC